jgi:hypothetical protein
MKSEKTKYFKNLEFDEAGRYLIMHQKGGSKYYRMNAFALIIGLGTTIYNYYEHPTVFFN